MSIDTSFENPYPVDFDKAIWCHRFCLKGVETKSPEIKLSENWEDMLNHRLDDGRGHVH